jgi:hypothetical protein
VQMVIRKCRISSGDRSGSAGSVEHQVQMVIRKVRRSRVEHQVQVDVRRYVKNWNIRPSGANELAQEENQRSKW